MDDLANLFAESVLLVIGATLLAVAALTIRFVWRDARRRGKPPALVVLLCLLSFPLGLIVWLIFRPEPLPPAQPQFGLEGRRAP
jgi:drug/metabolite transporter (DMT)-like permease